MVLMLTGVLLLGSRATLLLLRKKAKTSLKGEVFGGANSGYSSDPNTYWKVRVAPVGTKSNSKTVASLVVLGATIWSSCGSPGSPRSPVALSVLLGPMTFWAKPLLR